MNMALTRDAILAIDDRKIERVEVPEWGGHVFVRSLTGRERDAFEAETMQTKKGKQQQNFENFRARFVALCMTDESGDQLFKTRNEISMLGSKSVAALQRVFNKAQELNGMDDDDVDEMTADFEEAPQEDSTFDSPVTSE